MEFTFDHYNNLEDVDLYLCNPDGSELYPIVGFDRNLTLRFNDLSTLSFNARSTSVMSSGKRVKLDSYDYLQTKRLILAKGIGYFQISNVNEVQEGEEKYKSVQTESYQTIFKNRGIISYDKVYCFYNANDKYDKYCDPYDDASVPSVAGQLFKQLGIQQRLMDQPAAVNEVYPEWTLVYITPTLKVARPGAEGIYRSFKDETVYGYDWMVRSVEDAFGIVILFDFEHRAIYALTPSEATSMSNVIYSFSNAVKSLEVEENAEELVTVLNCNGQNCDIIAVNPTGTNYICDFSYYMDEKNHRWMSQPLINKLKTWKADVESSSTEYRDLVLKIQEVYTTLEGEKVTLQEMSIGISDLKALAAERNNIAVDSNGKPLPAGQLIGTVGAEKVAVGKTSIMPESDYFYTAFTGSTRITAFEQQPSYVSATGGWVLSGGNHITDTADNIIKHNNDPAQTIKYKYFLDVKSAPMSYCVIEGKTRVVNDQEEFYCSGFTRYIAYCTSHINDNHTIIYTDHVQDWINLREDKLHDLNESIARHNEQIELLRGGLFEISNRLNIFNYFSNTKALLQELSGYWIEGDYNNDNISVTKEMTRSESMDREIELLNNGILELSKVSQPRYYFKIEAANLINNPELHSQISELSLGRTIAVEKEDGVWYYPSVSEISINLENTDSFSISFSNKLRMDDWGYTYADLISQSSATSRKVNANWNNIMEYSSERETLLPIVSDPLNQTLRASTANAQNQAFTVDETGILGRKKISDGVFDNEQMRIVNNVIIFTDDNWKTARSAFGKIYYKDENDNVKTSYGLIGDTIIGSLLVSNKMNITSANGGIFLDDKGINIVDATKKVVFRASTDGTVTVSGGSIAGIGDELNNIKQDVALKSQTFYGASVPTPPYRVNDVWFEGETGNAYICTNGRTEGTGVQSDWVLGTKYTDDTGLNQYITSNNQAMTDLSGIVDSKIQTYYQAETPSKDWSEEEKLKHIGDIWYNTTDKQNITSRWSGSNWDPQDAPKDVFDKIDKKRQIFYSTPGMETPKPPYDDNDLWVQGESLEGKIKVCINKKPAEGVYEDSDWADSSKYTDDSALTTFIDDTYKNTIEDLQKSIDGKIESYYQEEDPSIGWTDEEKTQHVGDVWYDTKAKVSYRWGVDGWKSDKIPTEIYDIIDKKKQVFFSINEEFTPTGPYAIGDLWAQGKYRDKKILVCSHANVNVGEYVESDWVDSNGYTGDEKLNTFLGTYTGTIESVIGLIDNKIDSYYQAEDPSLDWKTPEEKQKHIGDVWYNTNDDISYRWGGNSWKSDDVPTEIYDMIDKKRQIYYSTTEEFLPKPPYAVGDLWVQGNFQDKKILVCKQQNITTTYNKDDWTDSSGYIDSAQYNIFLEGYAKTIADVNLSIDAKIETYYQDSDPFTNMSDDDKKKHVGDLWYNTSDGTTQRYTFKDSKYDWEKQNVPNAVFDAIDKKRQVFYSTNNGFTPNGPYEVGDLWVQGEYDSKDIMVCKSARTSAGYEPTDWTKGSNYTSDEELNNFLGGYTGTVNDIKTLIDGKVESYYQGEDPSKGWNETAKKAHTGDFWYSTASNKSYTWSGTGWEESNVPDSVFAEIDKKKQIFYSDSETYVPSVPYAKGDLWVQRQFKNKGIYVCISDNKTAYAEKDWVVGSNYTDDSKLIEFLDGYTGTAKSLEGLVDAKIQTYYQNTKPSQNVDWGDGSKHIGDLWYNSSTGKDGGTTSRWDGSNWIPQSVPNEVFDKIDTKKQIFYSTNESYTPPIPYYENDLWVQGSYKEGKIKVCIQKKTEVNTGSEADWADADNYMHAIGTKISTYYQSSDPFANMSPEEKGKHVGDLWYNTSDSEHTTSRWDGAGWQLQNVPKSVFDDINGRRRIFYGSALPTAPYSINDLWFNGTSEVKGDIKISTKNVTQTGKEREDDWIIASKYTDDSAFNDFLSGKYPQDLNALNADIDSLNTSIDGKIQTWYQPSDPSIDWADDSTKKKHVGDIWYNNDPSSKVTSVYVESVVSGSASYSWEVQDIPTSVTNSIDQGMSRVRTIFDMPWYTLLQDAPKPPYRIGDIWFKNKPIQVSGGIRYERDLVMICVKSRTGVSDVYDSSDWVVKEVYNEDKRREYTVGNIFSTNKTTINGGLITTGTIVSNSISSHAITSDKLATNAITSVNYKPPANLDIYAVSGTFLDLSNGAVTSKNFTIGKDGAVHVKGVINASSGQIGGFYADDEKLYSYYLPDLSDMLGTAAGFYSQASETLPSMYGNGTSPIRIFAGAEFFDGQTQEEHEVNISKSTFAVLDDGTVYIKSGNITGHVDVTSGSFNGDSIRANNINCDIVVCPTARISVVRSDTIVQVGKSYHTSYSPSLSVGLLPYKRSATIKAANFSTDPRPTIVHQSDGTSKITVTVRSTVDIPMGQVVHISASVWLNVRTLESGVVRENYKLDVPIYGGSRSGGTTKAINGLAISDSSSVIISPTSMTFTTDVSEADRDHVGMRCRGYFLPYTDTDSSTTSAGKTSRYSLGDAYHWWKNIYCSTSMITISDEKEKNTIVPLSDRYSQLFDRLQPVSFKYNSGTSDRTHLGMIAQSVEQSMNEVGLSGKDFAGLIKESSASTGDTTYGLRYTEFVPMCIAEIQKLKEESRVLKDEIRLLKEKK